MHVVFDVGGVLIDWNREYVYRDLIPEPERRDLFLSEICSPAWNAERDLGEDWADAAARLTASHPEWRAEIEAYRARWHDMVRGPMPGGFELLRDVRKAGGPVTILSNWAADTFRETVERFPALNDVDGSTVSGMVGCAKPDPAIYQLHEQRFGLEPGGTVFIDDNSANIDAARTRGWRAIQHMSAVETRAELVRFGVL